MRNIRLAPAAEKDIEGILAWSDRRFGETVRLRYEALLVQSLLDLSEDSQRVGVELRTELGTGIYSYHLRFSRDRVEKTIGRIQKPRHFLLFRAAKDGALEVGRVLHDSMELSKHLPPEYHPDDSDE
ncbi:MAG: type II toxin-antitoxin system RelE/ParE family toxin [Bdellovibrionales bacterium]|nr:type II toxin-antitoxin system RelE/ParE family toxin [Bdellovibrionales bacterium]